MAEPRKIKTRVINKHAQAAVWENTTFTPLEAELVVYDKDNEHSQARLKIGDGSHNVNELPFITAGTADQLTKARQISVVGDVTGSASFDGSRDISISTELSGTFESSFTGEDSSHSHTFTGDNIDISIPYTPKGTVDVNYTPKGTVSAPDINVDAEVKTINVVTSTGTQASYTQGSCTFPTLKGSLNNKQLTLTVDGGSYTPGVYQNGVAPSTSTITYVESVSAEASAPTFTGTGETVTSTIKGETENLNATIKATGEISNETIKPEGTVSTTYKN